MKIFKLFKENFKNTFVITLTTIVILLIGVILAMALTRYFYDFKWSNENGSGSVSGAIYIMTDTSKLYGITGIIGLTIYVFVMLFVTLHVEINRGLIVNYLTLPITRSEIYISKIINLFVSLFLVVFPMMIIQFLITISYKDFDANMFFVLFKLDLGMYLYGLFIASIGVLIFSLIRMISIASIVFISINLIFALFGFLSEVSSISASFLRYLTPSSLWDYKTILINNDYSYLWKYLVLIILTIPSLIGGWSLFEKMDMNI
ncbi:ABC transporter permease subunit [Spiroplasma endosymbiont of Othius punctulatus]|uniref:ABC transporter permease subunit n=1 Tax=Spiroplasma endosymbiont of Othius punctulatus TaxID=3066289 RepID=UPI0030CED51B